MADQTFSNPAQRRKLGRGMVLSVAGVLICWIPGLGALLSLLGLFGVIAAYVPECRFRYPMYVLMSICCALVSVGVLMLMLYVYFGNPDLLSQVIAFVMTKLNIQ